MKRIGAIMLLLVAASGCARVEVRPVKDGYTDGIRFYRPDLYLLVTEDGDKKTKGQIVALPDKTQEYFVRTTAGFGSVEANVTLTDGWNLTGLDSKADSKVSELITAAAALAPVFIASKTPGEPQKKALSPGLYRIEVQQGVLQLKEVKIVKSD